MRSAGGYKRGSTSGSGHAGVILAVWFMVQLHRGIMDPVPCFPFLLFPSIHSASFLLLVSSFVHTLTPFLLSSFSLSSTLPHYPSASTAPPTRLSILASKQTTAMISVPSSLSVFPTLGGSAVPSSGSSPMVSATPLDRSVGSDHVEMSLASVPTSPTSTAHAQDGTPVDSKRPKHHLARSHSSRLVLLSDEITPRDMTLSMIQAQYHIYHTDLSGYLAGGAMVQDALTKYALGGE